VLKTAANWGVHALIKCNHLKKFILNTELSWAWCACLQHSYSGGRGLRIESSRPVKANLGKPYLKNTTNKPTPVAHTCNPSYSGSRDQEHYGSKPALGK
jgi:hypothetical protein